jgi:hypothetical protein
MDAKTACSSRQGSPKLKRKEMAAAEQPMPLDDNYVPVKLTRKVLEQRNMTYVLAADDALGDGSIRTTKDLSQWVMGVLGAMALAQHPPLDPPAIDEAEAELEQPVASTKPETETGAGPTAPAVFNPEDATLALAALKAKFKTDRADSSDSFSRDRSNTVTSTRARVGSASQAVRQRVAQLSTPPSTREGSKTEMVRCSVLLVCLRACI